MQIIDCFTFFNEIDLLKVRLNEPKDVVDRFVLIESGTPPGKGPGVTSIRTETAFAGVCGRGHRRRRRASVPGPISR